MVELNEYLEKEAIKLREQKGWLKNRHQKALKIIRDELSEEWGITRQTFYNWVRQKYIVLEVRGRPKVFKPLTEGEAHGELI